jgi:hypothetical protein
VPRPLYRHRQGTLMFSTGTGSTPRLNLASIRYKVAQFSRVFVVYLFDLTNTKGTNLALGDILCPALPSAPRFARSLSIHLF